MLLYVYFSLYADQICGNRKKEEARKAAAAGGGKVKTDFLNKEEGVVKKTDPGLQSKGMYLILSRLTVINNRIFLRQGFP